MTMIDWTDPHWGETGHNVHMADNGSWSSPNEPGDDS